MGGGGTTVKYEQPKDPWGDEWKKWTLEQAKSQASAAEQEKLAASEAEKAKKEAAEANLPNLIALTKQQLGSGLLSYEQAQGQISDYLAKTGATPSYNQLQNLSQYYTTQIQPGQQKSQIEMGFQELLGRAPTEEELTEAQKGFSSGYYKSVGDLKDTLKSKDEYQDKFNKSYLENYYETMFGKAEKDEAGSKKYNFKLNESLFPTYSKSLASKTGVDLPEFQTEFKGTAGEVEANLDAIKDTKNFVYSSGLMNLQGNIDKEVQKLKNEGSEKIAKLQTYGNLYGSLVSGFNF